MVAATNRRREDIIRESERETRKWSGFVDTLLRVARESDQVPPAFGSRVEELRNKRDSVVTKVEALKRHKERGWSDARREFRNARSEMRSAWRAAIGSLEKDGLFV